MVETQVRKLRLEKGLSQEQLAERQKFQLEQFKDLNQDKM